MIWSKSFKIKGYDAQAIWGHIWFVEKGQGTGEAISTSD